MAYSRTYPLRTTLVIAVVATALSVILILFLSSGLPAYFRTEKTFQLLWQDIAKQSSEHITEQTLKYFQSAPISMRMITGLAEEGIFVPDRFEIIFDICYKVLAANPNFANVYFISKDKNFYEVLRDKETYVGSFRRPLDNGKALFKNYRIGPDHTWILSEERVGDYDPEKRPYWITALAYPEGGWTDPYVFATTNAHGFTYVLGQKLAQEMIGYWCVDFQTDHLKDFFKQIKLGDDGEAWIIAQDGTTIAQTSKGEVPELGSSGFFYLANKIYYINSFPKQWQIPWKVVISIHQNDFIHPIRRSALISLVFGLIPSLLFVFISVGFFGNVSNRLKEIAWELDDLSRLAFKEDGCEPQFSRIQEINMMNRALIHLRAGLQSFAKYSPVDLVKKLISSGKAAVAGAEKKQITVLFADLAGFTSMAENLSVQEVTNLVFEFLTTVSQEVHHQKGIIDKFIGDAVMALWGTPEPMENHALAACKAALAIQKALSANPKMKHRIGINTGVAMVGNFGSNERLDYTAIGDTVNVAARLEKLSKHLAAPILIGPETALAVKEFLNVRPVKSVELDGRASPLLVYELLGEKNGYANE